MTCFLHELLLNVPFAFFQLSSWFESLLLSGKLLSKRGAFCKLDHWFREVERSFLRKSIVIVIIAPLIEASFKGFVLIPSVSLPPNFVSWAFSPSVVQMRKQAQRSKVTCFKAHSSKSWLFFLVPFVYQNYLLNNTASWIFFRISFK